MMQITSWLLNYSSTFGMRGLLCARPSCPVAYSAPQQLSSPASSERAGLSDARLPWTACCPSFALPASAAGLGASACSAGFGAVSSDAPTAAGSRASDFAGAGAIAPLERFSELAPPAAAGPSPPYDGADFYASWWIGGSSGLSSRSLGIATAGAAARPSLCSGVAGPDAPWWFSRVFGRPSRSVVLAIDRVAPAVPRNDVVSLWCARILIYRIYPSRLCGA